MRIFPSRPGRPRRLRLPRRTARLRLTILYGAAFLTCGAAVLALTYLLFGQPANPASASFPLLIQTRSDQSVLKVPVADVQPAGRYDLVTVSVIVAQQVKREEAAATPAQQAKVAAAEQAQNAATKRDLLTASAIALAVIAAAAAAIGWLIAGRVLRPLSTITAAARRISASSLHDRLSLPGPDDELKELGDTLDGLFARLEASFDAQRRFAASASHELRTPLTRERALLQVTRADPAATVATWQAVSAELLASNAEQERLIEALLTLASSESGAGEHEPVDLAVVTRAALAAARPAITRLGLTVDASVQPAMLDGDSLLIQQLVSNLIDNAIKHNTPGGDIQIATSTGRAGAVLSVTSSGQVIPAAEVDRLFQPFQRLGARPARREGGYGLGLTIVRAIAAAHTATITAQPRPGGGLSIDVAFPPSAVPPARRPCGLQAPQPLRLFRPVWYSLLTGTWTTFAKSGSSCGAACAAGPATIDCCVLPVMERSVTSWQPVTS
jgi:signal transduction histidine kinase